MKQGVKIGTWVRETNTKNKSKEFKYGGLLMKVCIYFVARGLLYFFTIIITDFEVSVGSLYYISQPRYTRFD